MRTFLTYFQLELKRAFKSLPYFLAGAIVLALLAGTIAFSASKMIYGEQALSQILVGVVLPKEDRLAKMAVSMISSLDSVGSLCEFVYLEKEEGGKKLKKGELFALMEVPEGLIEGIIDGANLPVTVILPERAGLESAVFKELTEAGASMLSTSQAAIYGADEMLTLYRMESFIPQAERDLNNLYLKYALSRDSLFDKKSVSAAGDVPVIVFYAISASVLALLLLGVPAASLLRPYGAVMERKLSLIGLGRFKRTGARTMAMTCCFLVTTALPFFWCLREGYFQNAAKGVFMWILVCAAASGWILFIYELCGSTVAGILCLFLSTSVMMFLSGGIVPYAFLPEGLARIGQWMPTAFLMDGLKWMVSGEGFLPVGKLALMEGIVFCLSAAVRRDYE